MARVLIVGCGCRGRELARALVGEGHAVRGTSRRPERCREIEAAGAEAGLADPDRLATILPQLDGVSVLCWLVGGERVETLLDWLVDTPLRGFVYNGTAGAAVVRAAAERWRIPVEIVDRDPEDHEGWLAAMTGAVGRLLAT